MLNETLEQKEKRIFEHYKKDLLVLAEFGTKDHLRFNVIEYVCHFPAIDPYEMAKELVGYGVTIDFDDSSIGSRGNKTKYNKFCKLMARG